MLPAMIPADGQAAVAIANATKHNCTVVVRVHNKLVSWRCEEAAPQQAAHGAGMHTSLSHMWDEASRCADTPSQANSVQDGDGRLWGYDAKQAIPCAFRAESGAPVVFPGYVPLKFETAPACGAALTSANSMEDEAGRLWGWDQTSKENCAFKDASSGQPVYYAAPAPSPTPEAEAKPEARPEVSPSAAGVWPCFHALGGLEPCSFLSWCVSLLLCRSHQHQ